MSGKRRLALLLALAITTTTGCSHPTAPTSRASAPPASGRSANPTRTDGAAGSDPAAPVVPAAVDAAIRFIGLWGRPNRDPQAWLADVVPLATPGYGRALATIDPARVPAALPAQPPGTTTATGPAARVLTATPAGAVVVVPITGGTVKVTVLYTDSIWLVDNVEPGPTP